MKEIKNRSCPDADTSEKGESREDKGGQIW
jgi:hypothetical protein